MSKQFNILTAQSQNIMLAVRQEMGWPSFKPANDAICFAAGRPMDMEVGSELARICQQLRKDIVYSSWKSAGASQPRAFSIVYRELLTVDVIDHVVPYAANDQDTLAFVSSRHDEMFVVDRRGSLVRLSGKPKDIAKGRKLALKRIAAAAVTMDKTLLETNSVVPTGANWIEPVGPVDFAVRFG